MQHRKDEEAAGCQMWPATPIQDSSSKMREELDFCASLDCTHDKSELDWWKLTSRVLFKVWEYSQWAGALEEADFVASPTQTYHLLPLPFVTDFLETIQSLVIDFSSLTSQFSEKDRGRSFGHPHALCGTREHKDPILVDKASAAANSEIDGE